MGDTEIYPEEELMHLSASQSAGESDSGSEYSPSAEELLESSMRSQDSHDSGPVQAPKLIVFLSSLLPLFAVCRLPECHSAVDPDNIKVTYRGARAEIRATCNKHHSTFWQSSPTLGTGKCQVGVINLLLSSFCLTTGLHVRQALDFFSHMRIAFFSESFYYNIQNSVLEKSVWFHWLHDQKREVARLKERKSMGCAVKLAGDGQFDSRGFTAAYCSYSVQDLDSKKIVGLYVAEKKMVSYSGEMEPYCAKTVLLHLTHQMGLEVDSITTDRSTTMRSMIRNLAPELPPLHPALRHYFDIWHLIKAINKDVFAASKLKSCKDLEKWSQSINNMLWYSFSSSIDNPEMLKEKIFSIVDHMTDNHVFEENSEHKKCEHPPLPDDGSRTRPWLKTGSKAIKKVRKAIEGKDGSRAADLPMMCGFTHTGDIEQYNNLHNKYAPKDVFFSHSGMLVRTALTALDHNANTGRVQGSTKEGNLKFELITHRDGRKWFVRKVKEKKNTEWRDCIADYVLENGEKTEAKGDNSSGLAGGPNQKQSTKA